MNSQKAITEGVSAFANSVDSNSSGFQLHSVKVQPDTEPVTGRTMQAVLSKSFQPDTPDQPQLGQALLHTISSASNQSAGSNSDALSKDAQSTPNPVDHHTADRSGHFHQAEDSKPSTSLRQDQAHNSVQQDGFGALQDSAVKLLPEPEALLAVAAENRAAQLPEGEPVKIDNQQDAAEYKDTTGECPPGWVCPPGVSPFAVAPACPCTRTASDVLPPLPPHSGQKRHRAKAQDSLPHSPSRLRTQSGAVSRQGSARLQATASRTVSQMLMTFPGLESSTPFHNLLKKTLSRSLSNWLQAHPGLEKSNQIQSPPSTAQHSRLASPQKTASQALSSALSAQLYPGLEQAVSNWARQSQHDSPMLQSRAASRAISGMSDMPGLEQAISNWAQHAQQGQHGQHDRVSKLQPASEASRALSGMSDMPGLEQAITSWAQHAQHDVTQSEAEDGKPAVSDTLYAGLEQAISNWALQAQVEKSNSQQPPQPMSRAESEAMYPGLECAVSNWAQHAQQFTPHTVQAPAPAAQAMSEASEAWYPGLERAVSNWAQHAEQIVLGVLQSSDENGDNATEQSMPQAPSLPDPELERAVSDFAQHAQHDIINLLHSQATAPSRAVSETVSEAMYPGLERAVSNWAQHAQCLQSDGPQLSRTAEASSHASSLALEEMYPGLEVVLCHWAQEAQIQAIAPQQLAQAVSASLSHASEQSRQEDETNRVNKGHQADEDKQDLQQLQLAATVLAMSRAGSLYPGLEVTAPVPSQHKQLPSQAVNPESLTSDLEAATAADSAGEAAASSTPAGEAVPNGQDASENSQAHVQPGAAALPGAGSVKNEASAQQHSPERVSHVSHEMVPETSVNSPQATRGSPKVSSAPGAKHASKGAHADSMLKAHARDMGQRQQLLHSKLHQAHPPSKTTDIVPGLGLLHLNPEPSSAANDAFGKPPLAGKKAHEGAKGHQDATRTLLAAHEVA